MARHISEVSDDELAAAARDHATDIVALEREIDDLHEDLEHAEVDLRRAKGQLRLLQKERERRQSVDGREMRCEPDARRVQLPDPHPSGGR